jgi:hypothetical protein
LHPVLLIIAIATDCKQEYTAQRQNCGMAGLVRANFSPGQHMRRTP